MPDLDDATALARADDGRLVAIARAGAVLRQISRVPWPAAPAMRGDEVGCCGVLVADTLARPYGDALARLSMRLGAPLATRLDVLAPAGRFPRAADAVLLVSDTGMERSLLDALHLADSRGSALHVVAPDDSPIAHAATERRVPLATFEPTEQSVTAWWAAIGALTAAWTGPAELDPLADALDVVAGRLGPVVPTYDNPAKQIATMLGPLLVVAVDDDAALAAPLLAHEIGRHSDYATDWVDARHGFAELLPYADRVGGGADALFYDPQIDGPQASVPARQLVLLSGATDRAPAQDALPVAERIGPVRAVEFGPQERYNALAQVMLAQLSGSYYSLAND